MYYIYILYSLKNDRYYIGQCEDIDKRLQRHNKGGIPSTRPFKPWELVYTETFGTRNEAMAREKEIKGKKSRKYIEKLISGK
jgi:putative endonuclease